MPKAFGIKADDVVIAHLAWNPGELPLQIRLTLEGRTDYGDHPPETPLHLEIDGVIER